MLRLVPTVTVRKGEADTKFWKALKHSDVGTGAQANIVPYFKP